jgi:hypothetical protein
MTKVSIQPQAICCLRDSSRLFPNIFSFELLNPGREDALHTAPPRELVSTHRSSIPQFFASNERTSSAIDDVITLNFNRNQTAIDMSHSPKGLATSSIGQSKRRTGITMMDKRAFIASNDSLSQRD